MSAALLLDLALAHVRETFTPAEVADVLPYGGEFSAEEVGQLSFRCPAVLLTVLGWRPVARGARMAGRGVREVHLAAFVVAKHAQRPARLRQAAVLAERLCAVLRDWVPAEGGVPLEAAPIEDDPTAENLYGRAVDAKGLALWLVTWQQCCRATLAPAQMWDLLRVEITDHTAQGVGAEPVPGPAPEPLAVTEDVQFNVRVNLETTA